MHVRRATLEDLEQVFPLALNMATTAVVDRNVFAASFAQLMERDDAIVLVAEDPAEDPTQDNDNAIVGYLLGFEHPAFYANGRVSYVEEVAVQEDHRGRQIGRRLMDEFERWAASRSSVLVTVATRRAGAFYVALGYEETATLFKKLL
jgi:ribosomal protein S18 acetylase RimI-like enzyme